MKVTSQTRSPTCGHADVLAGEDVAEIHLPRLEADPPALRHGEGRIVERVGEFLEAAIRAC